MKIPAVVERVLQYLSQPQGGSTLGPISDWSDSRAQGQPKSNAMPQILPHSNVASVGNIQ